MGSRYWLRVFGGLHIVYSGEGEGGRICSEENEYNGGCPSLKRSCEGRLICVMLRTPVFDDEPGLRDYTESGEG